MAKINLPGMWHIFVYIITSFYFIDSRCDAVLAPVIAGGEPGRAAIARYDRWCQYIRKPVNVSVAAQQSPGGWSLYTHRCSFLLSLSILLSHFLVGGLYIPIGGPFLISLAMLLCHSFGGWYLITHSRWSFLLGLFCHVMLIRVLFYIVCLLYTSIWSFATCIELSASEWIYSNIPWFWWIIETLTSFDC